MRSVEPQQRFSLAEVSWDELNEPGAYVKRGSGDLYQVPQEALIRWFSHHPQRKSRGVPSGKGQRESLCYNSGSSASLCAAQY
jgi:hypothetical protein